MKEVKLEIESYKWRLFINSALNVLMNKDNDQIFPLFVNKRERYVELQVVNWSHIHMAIIRVYPDAIKTRGIKDDIAINNLYRQYIFLKEFSNKNDKIELKIDNIEDKSKKQWTTKIMLINLTEGIKTQMIEEFSHYEPKKLKYNINNFYHKITMNFGQLFEIIKKYRKYTKNETIYIMSNLKTQSLLFGNSDIGIKVNCKIDDISQKKSDRLDITHNAFNVDYLYNFMKGIIQEHKEAKVLESELYLGNYYPLKLTLEKYDNDYNKEYEVAYYIAPRVFEEDDEEFEILE